MAAPAGAAHVRGRWCRVRQSRACRGDGTCACAEAGGLCCEMQCAQNATSFNSTKKCLDHGKLKIVNGKCEMAQAWVVRQGLLPPRVPSWRLFDREWSECNCECSGRGECDGGGQCHPCWIGEDCSIRDPVRARRRRRRRRRRRCRGRPPRRCRRSLRRCTRRAAGAAAPKGRMHVRVLSFGLQRFRRRPRGRGRGCRPLPPPPTALQPDGSAWDICCRSCGYCATRRRELRPAGAAVEAAKAEVKGRRRRRWACDQAVVGRRPRGGVCVRQSSLESVESIFDEVAAGAGVARAAAAAAEDMYAVGEDAIDAAAARLSSLKECARRSKRERALR